MNYNHFYKLVIEGFENCQWQLQGDRRREGRFTVDRSHKIKRESKAGLRSMAKDKAYCLMLEVVSFTEKVFHNNRLYNPMPSFA